MVLLNDFTLIYQIDFFVNLLNYFSEMSKLHASNITCGASEGSIFNPLLFLIYANDMPMAVKCKVK